MKERISQAVRKMNDVCASPQTVAAATAAMAAWTLGGFFFHFSSDYQLVLNTVTTIISFVMFFVITNAQRRDTESMSAKLDALILWSHADNKLVSIEDHPDEHVARARAELRAEAAK